MIRLSVAAERIAPRVELSRAERHYLVDVLRLEVGAPVEVFDGRGGRYPAKLATPDSLELGVRVADAPSPRVLVLAQALAKADKMELVVQKATELGATAIAPFSASRSVVRLEGAKAEDRVRRWQRIAEEAARQCGRADVPPVRPLTDLAGVVAQAAADGGAALVLFEKESARRLSTALLARPGPLTLVVGPEGGFTDEEVRAAEAQGAESVTLGRRILRTETAGLAALAVARFLDGDLA